MKIVHSYLLVTSRGCDHAALSLLPCFVSDGCWEGGDAGTDRREAGGRPAGQCGELDKSS